MHLAFVRFLLSLSVLKILYYNRIRLDWYFGVILSDHCFKNIF